MTPVNYGWRSRVGLIYIASSVVMEPEFQAMLPTGVSLHTTRIALGDVTPNSLAHLTREGGPLDSAVALMAECRPSVLVLGCTSGSFIKGLSYDRALVERMQEQAGCPAMTTSTAVAAAIDELSLSSLSVATPYTPEINERARAFLNELGCTVNVIDGLGLTDDWAIGEQTSQTVYRLAREVDHPDSQAVFISCTNLRTAEILSALEVDLGKPVFSAISATVWHALRCAGVAEGIPGYGQLLERPGKIGR